MCDYTLKSNLIERFTTILQIFQFNGALRFTRHCWIVLQSFLIDGQQLFQIRKWNQTTKILVNRISDRHNVWYVFREAKILDCKSASTYKHMVAHCLRSLIPSEIVVYPQRMNKRKSANQVNMDHMADLSCWYAGTYSKFSKFH